MGILCHCLGALRGGEGVKGRRCPSRPFILFLCFTYSCFIVATDRNSFIFSGSPPLVLLLQWVEYVAVSLFSRPHHGAVSCPPPLYWSPSFILLCSARFYPVPGICFMYKMHCFCTFGSSSPTVAGLFSRSRLRGTQLGRGYTAAEVGPRRAPWRVLWASKVARTVCFHGIGFLFAGPGRAMETPNVKKATCVISVFREKGLWRERVSPL